MATEISVSYKVFGYFNDHIHQQAANVGISFESKTRIGNVHFDIVTSNHTIKHYQTLSDTI
jgi:hypothetical protein